MRFLFSTERQKKANGNQSQAKNTVLSDICGRQYSIMKENVLANSKDANELAKRLESLRESWENLCSVFHK